MSIPSPQCKAVAKHTLHIFKGDLKVQAYYDDDNAMSVDLLTTVDSVHKGVKSIGTIGLSETPLLEPDGSEFVTRVELCAGALISENYWENVVASAAFYLKKRRMAVMPGYVIPHVFSDYIAEPIMPHVYLTVPFIWNDAYFPELIFSKLKINWLQCMAIYDIERAFIERFGSDEFDNLLSEQEINTLDSGRAPVFFG